MRFKRSMSVVCFSIYICSEDWKIQKLKPCVSVYYSMNYFCSKSNGYRRNLNSTVVVVSFGEPMKTAFVKFSFDPHDIFHRIIYLKADMYFLRAQECWFHSEIAIFGLNNDIISSYLFIYNFCLYVSMTAFHMENLVIRL